MPTISISPYSSGGNYAFTTGYRGPTNSWTGVRNATTGTGVQQSNPGIRVSAISGGRGISYNLSRLWMWFDTSAYSNITDITLNISCLVSPTITFDIQVVEGDGFNNNTNTTLTTAEFNDLDFNNAYLNSTGAWNNIAGLNSYTLNSSAVTDCNANSKLGICVINEQWDYQDVDPYSGISFDFNNYVDFGNPSKTNIAITYTSGYGNEVNGVASGDIGEVNGVSTGDIGEINGI
tara:strand:- start:2011 stop:2712 length:702 start_codon:yes stop_codon:yes gene_type:complete